MVEMLTADEARARLAERLSFDEILSKGAAQPVLDAIDKKESKAYVCIPRASFLKLSDTKVKEIINKWARGLGYDIDTEKDVKRLDALGSKYAYVGFWISWEVKKT